MPTQEDYVAAIKELKDLAPAMEVVSRASTLVQDPDVDMSRIVDLVKTDTALTADIIRLSNSGMYGYTMRNTSLASGIARIGFQELYRLLNVTAAKRSANEDLSHYGISANTYWSTSVTAAMLMEAFANRMGENPHTAYTLGVVHSIGKQVINHLLDEFNVITDWDGKMPQVTWEQQAVGFDYAFAGSTFLEIFGFPKNMVEDVAKHRQSFAIEEESFNVGALAFALKLMQQTGVGFENEDFTIPEDDPFLTCYNLADIDVEEMVGTCRVAYAKMQKELGMA